MWKKSDPSEQVLEVRDLKLKRLDGKGQLHDETRCQVKRCRLLAQLGRPLEEDLAAARTAAGRFRDPAPTSMGWTVSSVPPEGHALFPHSLTPAPVSGSSSPCACKGTRHAPMVQAFGQGAQSGVA